MLLILSLLSSAVVLRAESRVGDNLILGGQGEGCGPKFIFKASNRQAKEFFVLNDCKQDVGVQVTPRSIVKLVPIFIDRHSSAHSHTYPNSRLLEQQLSTT